MDGILRSLALSGAKPLVSAFKVSNSEALTTGAGATLVTRAAAAAGTVLVSAMHGLASSSTADTDWVFTQPFRYVVIEVRGSASAADGDALRHSFDTLLQDSSATVPAFNAATAAGFEFGPPVSQALVQGQAGALTSGDPEVASIVGTYIAVNVKRGDLIRFQIEALVGDQTARNLDIYVHGFNSIRDLQYDPEA